MTNLNLDPDYFNHPKTSRLIGLCGRGAEVMPIRLWAFCGKHRAKDGVLADFSPQEIETVAGWWGRPGEAVEAMLKVGFLERAGDGYQVHDWKAHQGHIHALKVRNKKAAISRWKKLGRGGTSDATTVDTSGMPHAMPKSTSGMPHTSLTNQPTNETKEPKTKHIGATFTPPSLAEVQEYVVSQGFVGFDPNTFVNFYESKGWMVGKTKMKNWRAAVSGWHHRSSKGGANGYKTERIGATPVPGKYAHLSS